MEMSVEKNWEKRILLIDDDPESLKIMKATLDWEGYLVDVATSGQMALDKIGSLFSPHLVLLDINMPNLDGLETLRRIRQSVEHVSTIFVSGETETEAVIRGLDAGADDYICKPFHPMELLARIRTQLRIKYIYDELQKTNAKLKDLVNIDDLTGLFNMRSLFEKLDHEIERMSRHGGFISVLMLDMDDFKSVNDQNDHLFGSYVLSEVGKILRKNIRKIDFASRYGGDEFLIIITDTDLAGSLVFAERIRSLVGARTFENDGCRIQLTVSVGVAIIGEKQKGMDSKTLIKYADKALYEAKDAGRNCVRYHKFKDEKNVSPPQVDA